MTKGGLPCKLVSMITMTKIELTKRYACFITGLLFNSLAIVLITKAGLGTSPISSLPYVLSLIFPLSLGGFTFIINMILIAGQAILLKKDFAKSQYLQIPVTILFSFLIDAFMSFFRFLNPTVYWMQVICLLAGCVCLGLGISLEVQANVVILAGEGAVKAISQRFNTEFGVTKTFFDITLVAVSLVLSLVFLGRVSGLREGTAAAALCVGSISRFFIGRLCFLQDLFKGRPAENAGAEV